MVQKHGENSITSRNQRCKKKETKSILDRANAASTVIILGHKNNIYTHTKQVKNK
jgi:hypothetical protein